MRSRLAGLAVLVSVLAGCSLTDDLDSLVNKARDGGGADATADAAIFPGSLPNGALCASDASCFSKFCASGMCCNVRCDGACQACTAAAKESGETDGECGPAKAGTDPRDDCADDGAGTCQHDGKCDGQGGCRLFTKGTRCGEPSCQSGLK